MGIIWESINASNQPMLTHVPNGQIAGSPLCLLILVASLRLCLSSHVTRVPESLHPPIQGVYALPDALPFLCPSPKSLHDERKVDFIHQQHFLLALNHTACGSYVTSRGRVEVNRRQRPKRHPSHVCRLSSSVPRTMLG